MGMTLPAAGDATAKEDPPAGVGVAGGVEPGFPAGQVSGCGAVLSSSRRSRPEAAGRGGHRRIGIGGGHFEPAGGVGEAGEPHEGIGPARAGEPGIGRDLP